MSRIAFAAAIFLVLAFVLAESDEEGAKMCPCKQVRDKCIVLKNGYVEEKGYDYLKCQLEECDKYVCVEYSKQYCNITLEDVTRLEPKYPPIDHYKPFACKEVDAKVYVLTPIDKYHK
mmetsp:Transcript_10908/g.27462  ORF Transcript_10908/g.27462 Transcript_10908/m.27462 type:complete len:118 (+) Transcript_10908:505-858(+)